MYIMYTNTNGLLILIGCSPLSMMMHVHIFILCYIKNTRTGHLLCYTMSSMYDQLLLHVDTSRY